MRSARGGGPTSAVVLLLVGCLVASGCDKPGLRALGTGEVTFEGGEKEELRGVCTYVVGTRWGSPLPHELRLEDAGTDRALIVRARRRFRSGVSDVGGSRRFVTRALLMEGSTVRGSVTGTLAVEALEDSLVLVLSGERRYRDTVEVRAQCRVGAG